MARWLKRSRTSHCSELWRLFDISQHRLIRLCPRLPLICRRMKSAQRHSVASLFTCHHQAWSSLITVPFSLQWPPSIRGNMNANLPAARLSVAQSSFESGCLFKIVCQHLRLSWGNRWHGTIVFSLWDLQGNTGGLKGDFKYVLQKIKEANRLSLKLCLLFIAQSSTVFGWVELHKEQRRFK